MGTDQAGDKSDGGLWPGAVKAEPGASPSIPGLPPLADTEPFTAQILPRALSCAVLLLLLVAVLSRGKRCRMELTALPGRPYRLLF